MNSGFTYILSNKNRTALYIGVTNNIYRRVTEHRNGEGNFTSRYKCYDLLYYEYHSRITDAIAREKQLKNWHKDWKWNLIKQENPNLKDLFDEISD